MGSKASVHTDNTDILDTVGLSTEKRMLLAQLLREEGIESPQSQTILPRENPDELPLSFAQQRLWFLNQLEPESACYNEPTALHLAGSLNLTALEQSINEIVRRHEVLRIVFTPVEGQPVQIIRETLRPPLPLVDLQELPENEREVHIRQSALAEFQQPFDLAQGPLLRLKLLRLAEEEHILLLTMHHSISDGWSVGVFFKELAALYGAFCLGNPSPLPKLSLQYADFGHWQRQWLHGEVLEESLAYWKEQLSGNLPMLELPSDQPRPSIQTFRGARHYLSLPVSLSTALKTLSSQEDVTLFMTLLAAFQTLLYRYTSQDDVLIGSPIAGRNWPAIEGLIGCFLNTLALRTDLSGNPSFRELLGRVRKVALEAYAHQDLPFEYLVEELRLERDLSRNPLFQIMFVLQNPLALELPGLSVTLLRLDRGAAPLDVILSLEDAAQGLTGWWEYNTDLFDAATITRMTNHFQTLLEGVVANPEQRLLDFPLLTDAERQQVLVEWNATQVAYPRESCIHELFEAQVARTPEVVAVVYEGEQLTYQALNQRANQLAHYLQGLGVRPDTLVGIFLERSLDMLVGLLGVLKAGGAYVPLDPTYPKERLAFMVADSGVGVLLTHQSLRANLPSHHAHVVCLDTDWEAIADEPQDSPTSRATAESPAYVIYTSGSMGIPKGVEVLHRGVVNFLTSMAREPGLTAQDTLLAVTTLSFDIAVLELLLPLVVGAQVIVVSREAATDGVKLHQMVAASGATVMQATPATWRLLITAGWQGSPQLRLLCGGEALPRELADQLVLRGQAVWNLYGPTETTIWSTVARVEASERSVSIGRPIANTQIYLLDAQLHPVPIGVPGEVHIGGDGLARGYLHRPELTAEKFIPDPFSEARDARLYKTGDLARYRPDGTLEYLGRLDHQVKVRGFRIELGEIETVLDQHVAVQQSVVVVCEDPQNNPCLVAYVVTEGQHTPLGSELRQWLRKKMPDYMVPSVFVFLDALPLTPNGKVDRKALPAPDPTRPVLKEAFVAPRNSVEEQMAEIWAQVLRLERVGIHDNFFDLGGHSLLAAQVISRLREVFQVELPLRSLFEGPTLASLAEHVEMVRLIRQDLQASSSATGGEREEIEL